MKKCQHSWAAVAAGGEAPLDSSPGAQLGTAGTVRWCPVCPCAGTEAALPPLPALGRAGLGCETKSSLYSLLENSKGCAWPIVVSVSVWGGSGFGGITAKGDSFSWKREVGRSAEVIQGRINKKALVHP